MILLWGLRPGALALHVPPDALTARRVGYQALPTWDPQQLDSPKPVRMKYDWRAARGAFDRERWVGRKPDVHLHVAERSLLSLVRVSLPFSAHERGTRAQSNSKDRMCSDPPFKDYKLVNELT